MSNFGGTSGAAPQVAGAAALLLSVNPNLTEAALLYYLQVSATDMGATGFDNTYGYGRLNLHGALSKLIQDMATAVSGPDNLCSSSNYTIANNYFWTNITWSASPSGIVNVTPNGNDATVTKITNGVVTLFATLSNGCGSVTIAKQVVIGTPAPDGICGPPYTVCSGRGSEMNSGTFFVCDPFPGVTPSYLWQIDGMNRGTDPTVLVHSTIGLGTHTIRVRYTWACGTSAWTQSGFEVIRCPNPLTVTDPATLDKLVISPNPARSSIQVSLRANQLAVSTDNRTIQKITITDKLGNAVKSINYVAGIKSTSINLSDLKPDVYVLRAYTGSEWITKQLIIE